MFTLLTAIFCRGRTGYLADAAEVGSVTTVIGCRHGRRQNDQADVRCEQTKCTLGLVSILVLSDFGLRCAVNVDLSVDNLWEGL
jgi:hypothetical protein